MLNLIWNFLGFRPLMLPDMKLSGRNNLGRITVFHRGGGRKSKMRVIDFRRSVTDTYGVVKRIEYDPKRSSFIALIYYEKLFLFSYIILPHGLRIGDFVVSGFVFKFSLGNACPALYIPFGIPIHNIEIKLGKGGQLVRSAGCQAFIMKKVSNYVYIKIAKNRIIRIGRFLFCSIGRVSNIKNMFDIIGKAGSNRNRGRRPTVRGVAMNPIDHPHGGGEGKTAGGRPSVTPWGKLCKGPKTRKGRFSLVYCKSKLKVN